MKLLENNCSQENSRQRFCRQAAFTLVEVMVSFSLGLLVIGGVSTFLYFESQSFSGITAQNVLNSQGGNTIELIQSRARLATSISNYSGGSFTNYPGGNILSMTFDDDTSVDSDGDGKSYDDKNHIEQFKFIGVNSTNSANCMTNKLVYIPNTTSTNQRVLITKGVRNLPGYNIFNITNDVIAIIRFGIADVYTKDFYQAIDIQGTAVSLNRPATTNFISVIP